MNANNMQAASRLAMPLAEQYAAEWRRLWDESTDLHRAY